MLVEPAQPPGAEAQGALATRDFGRSSRWRGWSSNGRSRSSGCSLGTHWHAPGFKRYFDMPPLDDTREAVMEGPEESLAELRTALSTTREVLVGLSGSPRVPFRLFFSAL